MRKFKKNTFSEEDLQTTIWCLLSVERTTKDHLPVVFFFFFFTLAEISTHFYLRSMHSLRKSHVSLTKLCATSNKKSSTQLTFFLIQRGRLVSLAIRFFKLISIKIENGSEELYWALERTRRESSNYKTVRWWKIQNRLAPVISTTAPKCMWQSSVCSTTLFSALYQHNDKKRDFFLFSNNISTIYQLVYQRWAWRSRLSQPNYTGKITENRRKQHNRRRQLFG